jgi:hypothetical protein
MLRFPIGLFLSLRTSCNPVFATRPANLTLRYVITLTLFADDVLSLSTNKNILAR